MKLSIRAYARHRGVTDRSVRKAIAVGRIKQDKNGKINAEKADLDWKENTDASKQRIYKEEKDPERESSIALSSGYATFAKVKTAHEFKKLKRTEIALQKEKGELINKYMVKTQVFNLGRQVRDSWMNWPARVSALMAADLGVDEHTMHSILERYVREHLNDIGEGRLNFD